MNETLDSIYPDLLKTGLSKLGQLDARRELLALFSALENFRRDLHAQGSTKGILQTTHRYVAGLNLFHTMGFWLVNSNDFSFELALAVPDNKVPHLRQVVDAKIKTGQFAAALRQNAPAFFHAGSPASPERGIFHSLALSSQAVGMFCGLLHHELAPNQEINFSLLSLLLGSGADALATLHKTTQLTHQVETLSSLVPLCAWCKKVRDDKGYWEQIEQYFTTHSAASFTHGVCPDCQKKLLAAIPKT
jgi:hypothetical protein